MSRSRLQKAGLSMVPRVAEYLDQLGQAAPVLGGPVTLVHAQVAGKPVKFCVNMRRDPIQRSHRQGTFYELPELEALTTLFPTGGVFVDIGANVGNHSLFAALFLGASRVIPFEPNPRAYDLLIQNVLVNRLEPVFDLSHLGYGVSDRREGGFAMEDRSRNLGGARMLAGAGDLVVRRADEMLHDVIPDFIKIDVEGMEIKALDGLSKLLGRCRPAIMIEVDVENEAAFAGWVEAAGYAILDTHQRYRRNRNHLIVDAAMKDAMTATYRRPDPDLAAQWAAGEMEPAT